MFKSIQWKMTAIYLLLILLAMEFIGVYLLQSLEKYYLEDFSQNLSSQAHVLSDLLESHMKDGRAYGNINDLADSFARMLQADVFVVDADGLIVGSQESSTVPIGTRLLLPEVKKALGGHDAYELRYDPDENQRYRYLAVPVLSEGKVIGAVHLAASLEKIDNILFKIKMLLFSATVLAMVVTGVFGFALARTITAPIREVTRKAAAMAAGDFTQTIKVKSQDEIGQLGSMFNYLALRLRDTLTEISEEKSKVEGIITHMSDGVLAFNKDNTLIHINPAALELLNETEDAVQGKSADVVLSRFGRDFSPESLQKSAAKPVTVVKHSQGRDQALQLYGAPFVDSEGSISGYLVVIRDVTEEHRLATLRREFVANVSHELRTPLTTIKSYIETILDGNVEDRNVVYRFLSVVKEETDRMVRLVSDLLQLSRLDREASVKMEKISLRDIVETTVSTMEVTANREGINLSLAPGEQDARIRGDGDRIKQVIGNVLNNAIKYTPEGGSVSVSLAPKEGSWVVEVSDTGVGIPEEDLPRIFERFYRVDKARSRKLGGTGLGLSIAKQIMDAHQGSINIRSMVGKGTTVELVFPANEQEQETSE